MPLHVKIILASVREGRFGDKPAAWIYDLAKNHTEFSVELLDLKDYPLPMFAEAVSPAFVKDAYASPEVNRWAEKIAEADAFIVVTPEYNHGYPSSLKNNIDHLYKEWNNKPICFVAYGSMGGARAVQQLKEVSIELQMAPMRNAVHILSPWFLTEPDGTLKPGALDTYVQSAEHMLTQLTWWANALNTARNTP